MSTEAVNTGRRRFLTAATSVVGGVGVAFTAFPFLAYWQPSARAQAAGAPVEVDISKLEPGQRIIVEWRGKPVWIVRRTPEMLKVLPELNAKLRDPDSNESIQPDYAKNPTRAIKEEYLVVVGICTHLGCSPSYVKIDDAHNLGGSWKGGFFCPCHGSSFDLAGRVFQGVPAPTNLTIPPYMYVNDTYLLVGEDKGAA
ncbi:ubiquinol-cytochrome c reductase iron-sulfur subunit [Thioflexithrix psekupsensis]|uniref:Ubiquinol-cytochrome c reductase iron-sulfur subunit n=1 Tax=Thioflexithrix psekupsensis TaxID=1570016 RepID=A0A251X4C8_9GAMM|nr:ubiquinol-cytochrome c reductase iron-sulfur subunit [Thioflexithrix psekupsensis]OUD12246.1 ubiquinol-cytochrome c reductase iron-sulfur subunit [Thioflexithrix psekupsensis]